MRAAALAGALALLLASLPAPARAQDSAAAATAPLVRTGVAPETVTVGDRFRSTVLVMAPPGSRVRFPGVPLGDTLQQTGATVAGPAGAPAGAAAVYPLTAWVAEAPLAAAVEVTVEAPGAAPRRYRVPLRLPVVRSVLPADTSGLRPRPPSPAVRMPERPVVWPWALGAVVALGIGLAAWLALRRRTGAPVPSDPRACALAELESVSPDAEPAQVYADAARALRRYLAALRPEWGEEWTTTELLARLGSPSPDQAARGELARLLAEADRAKFSGAGATRTGAVAWVGAAREWILTYPPSAAGPAREAA